MKQISRIPFITSIPLTILVMFALLVGSVGAAHVDPVFVDGNPSCIGLGYDFGFKPQPEPPPSGTYDIDGFNTVTLVSDGTFFDWTSTLGMDAVIVKGASAANVYFYDPPAESFGDTGLHSPVNASGEFATISHIEFCYDYELTVSKTADTSFTRTFEWDIEKDFDAEYDLFTGDSVDHLYEVTVTKSDPIDSDWAASGTITIENNTPFAATITGVSDAISGFGAVAVDCGVTFPYELASGDTLECTYSTDLPNGDSRTNTATVTTSGDVGGGEATAGVVFGDPTKVVNDTINVDDTYAGDLGSFSDTDTVSYERTFACDGNEGQHDNTATIVETDESDDATVQVNCYALTVTKDADTSFTRDWEWTIEKSADQTDLLLSDGQLFQVNYEVTVDAVAVDSDFAVTGDIWVNNPAPIDAELTALSDIVSPAIAANVDCGIVVFPYVLVAGDTLHCTYEADLPDDADRTNTATATLQNYDYDSDGIGTPSGTTDFSGSANVAFSDTPDVETDECVDVNDTNVGFLGEVCADDAPTTFNYSLMFGKHADADVVLECGENTHHNIASFVANDTGATGEDDWTVNANVECNLGCTLTPGYWKTHSQEGPAPYDDAWANLSFLEEDTPFFLSLKTYYQVLWTPPQGNPYYILAHAYIAAQLNILNGASTTPQVDDVMDDATLFFLTHMPSQKLNKADRAEVIMWAGILDAYNNGLTGPGHCTE